VFVFELAAKGKRKEDGGGVDEQTEQLRQQRDSERQTEGRKEKRFLCRARFLACTIINVAQ
jgi:hypothetical protein